MGYKSRASESRREGAHGCSFSELTHQVLNVICDETWKDGLAAPWLKIVWQGPTVMGLETHEFAKWVIKKRESLLPFCASNRTPWYDLLMTCPSSHRSITRPFCSRVHCLRQIFLPIFLPITWIYLPNTPKRRSSRHSIGTS